MTAQAALGDVCGRGPLEGEYLGLVAAPFDVGGPGAVTRFTTARSVRDLGFLGGYPMRRRHEPLVQFDVAALAGVTAHVIPAEACAAGGALACAGDAFSCGCAAFATTAAAKIETRKTALVDVILGFARPPLKKNLAWPEKWFLIMQTW